MLKQQSPAHADKEYLKILYWAAFESESGVHTALGLLVDREQRIDHEKIEELLKKIRKEDKFRDPEIMAVDLRQYDELSAGKGVES